MSPLEVLGSSWAEFSLWDEYYRRRGTESDRAVWATAIGASAVCHAWGSKVGPEKLIPKFVMQRGASPEVLRAGLAAMAGAKVEKVSAEEMARRFKASRTI